MSERISPKRLLLSSVGPVREKFCLPARYQNALQQFVNRVARSLSQHCKKDIKFALSNKELRPVDYQSIFPAIEVCVRIYNQPVTVYLPVEVVSEFCNGLLVQTNNYILSQLCQKDAVAISYLAGVVLGDNSVFRSQRAYLQSVAIAEYATFIDQRNEKVFQLATTISGSDSRAIFCFQQSLYQRLYEEVQLMPPPPARKSWFQAISLSGEVRAVATVNDLHSLLSLKPGARIGVSIKESKIKLDQRKTISQLSSNIGMQLSKSDLSSNVEFSF